MKVLLRAILDSPIGYVLCTQCDTINRYSNATCIVCGYDMDKIMTNPNLVKEAARNKRDELIEDGVCNKGTSLYYQIEV